MAEIKTENQVRREFENYVLEVNGNEDMLNKWPSGSYKNPAVQGQYIGWRECEKRAATLSANAGKVDAVVDKSPVQESNDGGGAFNPDWLGRRNGWNDALDSAIEILHQLNDQSEVEDYFDMAIASIISLKSSTAQQAICDGGKCGVGGYCRYCPAGDNEERDV